MQGVERCPRPRRCRIGIGSRVAYGLPTGGDRSARGRELLIGGAALGFCLADLPVGSVQLGVLWWSEPLGKRTGAHWARVARSRACGGGRRAVPPMRQTLTGACLP